MYRRKQLIYRVFQIGTFGTEITTRPRRSNAFEQRYPDEEAYRKAWFAWRWPEGFKCPRCAQTEY